MSDDEATTLHQQIMNLPTADSPANDEWSDRRSAYLAGHRDARHAAAELVLAQASARPAPAWVPVAERLPEFPAGETSVECIVTTAHGSVTAMTWTFNQYAKTARGQAPRWEWHWRIAPWDVIAWAPLPAPYVPPLPEPPKETQ